MPFTDPRYVLLPGLRTEAYVLRPITATDAELDTEAVKESREYLRKWEQSTRPEDDFTVDDNRGVLIDLESWNVERKAFTYTVLDPSETVCLGCVYIFPIDAKFLRESVIAALGDDERADFDAVVYHWVRKSQMDASNDTEFFALLRNWLAEEWGFEKYLIVTNEQFVEQAKLHEAADMRLRFTFQNPQEGADENAGPGGRYLAFTDEAVLTATRSTRLCSDIVRVESMKSVPQLVSALAVAAALTLGGCSSGNSEDADIEPGQSAEVPSSDFDSTEKLRDFLTDYIDEVHVHRESESNPDFDPERDTDRLHVEFPSPGQTNTDKKATADAVQAAGSATFDYDVLMITGSTDTGTWSYIYSDETVEAMTKGSTVVEADPVWESADQDFDSVHR